jgi:hypothetical protein
MTMAQGIGVVGEVLGYWSEKSNQDSDSGRVEEKVNGIEIDEQGAVGLEDMR